MQKQTMHEIASFQQLQVFTTLLLQTINDFTVKTRQACLVKFHSAPHL